MKKHLFMLLVFLLVFMQVSPAFADEMDMKTVESVLQDIQKEQNVQDVKAIDPEKVSDQLLD